MIISHLTPHQIDRGYQTLGGHLAGAHTGFAGAGYGGQLAGYAPGHAAAADAGYGAGVAAGYGGAAGVGGYATGTWTFFRYFYHL